MRKRKTRRFAIKFDSKGTAIYDNLPKGVITPKEKRLLKKKGFTIIRDKTVRRAIRKLSARSYLKETGKRLR